MKYIASLLLATSALALAEVKVTPGDISDKRTTGSFFGGLEIDLKISGPELKDCKGMRIVLKEAKDDTGRAIPRKKNASNHGGFEMPQVAFGGFGKNKKEAEYDLKIELENPARPAKTITLDMVVELLIPSLDPKAVITAAVAKEAGKPLVNEALTATGATLTLKAAKGSEVGYTISDPKNKVAAVEFCNPNGTPLRMDGSGWSGFGGKKDVTINLEEKAPPGMVAKIYLVSDKSVVPAPVKLTGVALP